MRGMGTFPAIVRFLFLYLFILHSTASPITVLISPGAKYYIDFFKSILSINHETVSFIDEADVALNNNCVHDNIDLIIRGWWNNEPPCKFLKTNIFISSEPWDSTFVHTDLLIDCKLSRILLPPTTSTNFLYLPFYSFSFSQRFQNTPHDLIRLKISSPISSFQKRHKFCAFIAKNCMHERLLMMKMLNTIDQVDALGSCGAAAIINESSSSQIKSRNTIRGFETIEGFSYLDRTVEGYKDYKFVMCIENARIMGYVTEKIVNAFLAGAIPIYIGAPDIETHFNPKSFINCNRIEITECITIVRKIHSNDTLYYEMQQAAALHGNMLGRGFQWYSKPIIPKHETPNTLKSPSEHMESFISTLRNIFNSKELITHQVEVDFLNDLDVDMVNFPSISRKEAVVLKGLLPDPTYHWRARTDSLTDPLLKALAQCPHARQLSVSSSVSSFPSPLSTSDSCFDDYTVSCQMKLPSSSQSSYLACELARYQITQLRPNGRSCNDMYSIQGFGAYLTTYKEDKLLTSPLLDYFQGDNNIGFLYDTTKRTQQPEVIPLSGEEEVLTSTVLNQGFQSIVIVSNKNPAEITNISITTLLDHQKEPNEQKYTSDKVFNLIPIVSISKLDGFRLQNELILSPCLHFPFDSKSCSLSSLPYFEAQFKPNVNQWIRLLLSAAEYNYFEKFDLEGAWKCLISATEISPSSYSIYETAMSILKSPNMSIQGGDNITHLIELLSDRAAHLDF